MGLSVSGQNGWNKTGVALSSPATPRHADTSTQRPTDCRQLYPHKTMNAATPAHRKDQNTWSWRAVVPHTAALLLGVFCTGVSAQVTAPVVAPLETVVVYPERVVSAQVVARNHAKVAAQVGGVIAQWHADVGQRVAQGELLAEIEATDLQLAVAQAQAQWRTAQAQLQLAQTQQARAQKLTEQGFYSQEALNQSQTQSQVTQAQATAAQTQWDLAKRQLSKARITAPFSGEVTQRFAQTGETISPGAPLFVLSETSAPELWAELSTGQADSLRRARSAQISVGLRVTELQTRGMRISQSANASTRTHSLRMSLEPDERWSPGASAQLSWRESAAYVSADVVVRRVQGLGIFTVKDGKAVFHALPLAQEGQPALVDLPLDTPVVIQGQQRLQAGQSVNP